MAGDGRGVAEVRSHPRRTVPPRATSARRPRRRLAELTFSTQAYRGNREDAIELGCATFSYLYTRPLGETLGRLADLGFRRIQLSVSPPHLWPRAMPAGERAALRRLLDRRGLQVGCLNQRFADVNIASINPGIRDETLRQLEEDIDLAADLGAASVVIVPGKPTPLFSPPLDEIWRLAREGIERCVERAAALGVTCVIENTGYSLCPRGVDLVRLVREIDSQHCKIHYDVANANLYESPPDALRQVGPWLASVDLSDNDGRAWTHSPIGAGSVDWPAVATALREIDFGGVSWLEINVHENQDAVMRRAIEDLSRLGWER